MGGVPISSTGAVVKKGYTKEQPNGAGDASAHAAAYRRRSESPVGGAPACRIRRPHDELGKPSAVKRRTNPLSRLPCGRRFLGEFCSMHGIRADNAAPRMAWLRTTRHDDTKLNETKGVQNGAPVDVAPTRRSPYRRGGLRGLSPAEGGAERVWGRIWASECRCGTRARSVVTVQWQSEPPKRHCGFGQTFASLISASRAQTKLTGHSWRRMPGHRDA
jgi:hypothetical protein